MKFNFLKKAMLLSASGLVLGLTACDGGSGGSSGSGGTVQMSGAVVDGYIQGAKVCLDLNANRRCDPDEPSALTDSSGRYSFTVDANEAISFAVIADIPVGAIDSDKPAEPISQRFVMTTPIGEENVISPITSMARSLIDRQPGLTAEQAENSLLASLDFSETISIYDDYIEKKQQGNEYETLHEIAKIVAQETQQFFAVVEQEGLDLDQNMSGSLSLVMQAAVQNLGTIKARTQDPSIVVNLGLPTTKTEIQAAIESETALLESLNEASVTGDLSLLKQNRWVLFDVRYREDYFEDYHPLDYDSELMVFDFEKADSHYFTLTDPQVISYGFNQIPLESADDFDSLEAFIGSIFSENPQLTLSSLSGKTRLFKDLFIGGQYTQYLDGKSVTFESGAEQLNLVGKLIVRERQYPDEYCPSEPDYYYHDSEYNSDGYWCHYPYDSLHYSSLSEYVSFYNEENRFDWGDDYEFYFKPTDLDNPLAGGEMWRKNIFTEEKSRYRNYSVVTHEGKKYLIWGTHDAPFEDIVTYFNSEGVLYEVSFVARPGTLTKNFFNAAAADKILAKLLDIIESP